MKVICINNSYHVNDIVPKLEEGTIYIVTGDRVSSNGLFYSIQGFEGNDEYNFWYDVRGFIPLSTIDELELLEQRKHQYA